MNDSITLALVTDFDDSSDVISRPGQRLEVGVYPGHSAQLEEGDEVYEVAGHTSQDTPAHAGVTHPAVLRVQE